MDHIISVPGNQANTSARLTRNSKIFKTIISAIQDKKGSAIVSLDLKKIDEAVADYFIICQADSYIQLKAIADHIQDKVRELTGERALHAEYGGQWILVDYVNIVVHCFDEELRNFYDIEGLWADAGRAEHKN